MTDWNAWRQHVDYVIEQRGRWWGLADGDGNPLFTLPEPNNNDTPDQWMQAADLQVTFPARDENGNQNLLADKLLKTDISSIDSSGRLNPAQQDYMLLVAFAGEHGQTVRRGGIIVVSDAHDKANTGFPDEITIHATSVMDTWNTIPAMSWPAAWWEAKPYERSTDESGIDYKQSLSMARIELATRTTFTWKNGKAGFVIRRLAQESLDAAMSTDKDPDGTVWVDDPYHVVEVPETDNSPEISLEARDSMLWETVAKQAENAGIILGAHIWWPGDPPIRTWTPATSTMPASQVDISPSRGAPTRTIGLRHFPHAMIVLTAKEVIK